VRYRVKVEWENDAGGVESAEIGEVEAGACRSADDVGLNLVSAKELMARLQELVMKQQLSRHCEASRPCPECGVPRHIKDHRTRTLDTVLGQVVVKAPRFDGCRNCSSGKVASPLTDLLPTRVLPSCGPCKLNWLLICRTRERPSLSRRSSPSPCERRAWRNRRREPDAVARALPAVWERMRSSEPELLGIEASTADAKSPAKSQSRR
jgi:hypothetical protein